YLASAGGNRRAQYLVGAHARECPLVADHAILAFALVAFFAGPIVRNGVRRAGPVAAGTQARLVAVRQRVRKRPDVARLRCLGIVVRHMSSLKAGPTWSRFALASDMAKTRLRRANEQKRTALAGLRIRPRGVNAALHFPQEVIHFLT